jgi:hypothetical protein
MGNEALILMSDMAFADNFPFTGSFTQDDDVQLFNFTVGAPSTVMLRTCSYGFAYGPSLANGFSRGGQGNFTGPLVIGLPGAFWDVAPTQRHNHWAFDVLNVEQATVAEVPEPASSFLLATALAGVTFCLRNRGRNGSLAFHSYSQSASATSTGKAFLVNLSAVRPMRSPDDVSKRGAAGEELSGFRG